MSFPKLTLPDLRYGYNELEPILPAELLETHHKKHHQNHVNTYNSLSDDLAAAFAKADFVAAQAILPKLHFNLGGHNCHSLYWLNLLPAAKGGGKFDPNTLLAKAILAEWGSFDNFVKEFNKKTGAVQGSGWGWLAYDPVTKLLSIETTANQDIIEAGGRATLLTVDVWEHAYYLKYKNVRADYLTEIWKIMDWATINHRFEHAIGHHKH